MNSQPNLANIAHFGTLLALRYPTVYPNVYNIHTSVQILAFNLQKTKHIHFHVDELFN